MTKEEFRSKIDWEGGVYSALEYGLHESELADTPENQELIQEWRNLREMFEEIDELVVAMQDLLEEV